MLHLNKHISLNRYSYLEQIKARKGRPSVWMAQPSEISSEGRDDLKQAMTRYGGPEHFCKLSKLIPYKEWRFFESTLELFVELEKYLLQYEGGKENHFPKLSDIQNNGYDRLYCLIMEYGGRKLVATKLDMTFQNQSKDEVMQGLSLGKFSLSFAIRLMIFIRNDLLLKDPPLQTPKISMPTVKQLVKNGEIELAKDVIKYGGHESIARRLHLNYNEEEANFDAVNRGKSQEYQIKKRFNEVDFE